MLYKIIFLMLIFFNSLYGNSYDYILKKDLQGAYKEAIHNLHDSSYTNNKKMMEHANLGHIDVLNGNFKDAEKHYRIALTTIPSKYFIQDYDEMNKLYPNKKNNLNHGNKIIEVLLRENEIWNDILKTRHFSRKNLKKYGLTTAKEAKEWLDCIKGGYISDVGFQIRKYKKLGLTPKEYKIWKNARLNISNWFGKAHVLSISEVKEWKNIGADYNDVYYLKRAGINTPKLAQQWIDANVSMDSIHVWIESGIHTPKEAKQWTSISDDILSPHKIPLLKKIGINTPNKVKQWIDIGIKYNDILKWNNINIKTPKKAKSWIDVGVYNPRMLESLKAIEINSPKEYEPYKSISIEHILDLKKWKINPNQLIRSMSHSNKIWGIELFFNNKKNFVQAYNGLKGNCKSIENKFFANVDMYENNGKCYIFIAKLIQRIDKYHGLAEGTGHRYIYLNFNGSWKENTSRLGVVKGNEVFSYETQKNKRKSVPNGKILFMKQ